MSGEKGTQQVFVRIDTKILSKLRRVLPDVAINSVINELLFHLAETFHDEKFDIATFYKEAAERAKESLQNLAEGEGEES